jgi:hypothetical protein
VTIIVSYRLVYSFRKDVDSIMKRFFCSKCNKVKRVQQWPAMIESVGSVNVYDRVGECNWHSGYAPRVVRTVGQSFKKVKPVKVVAPVKTRKRA